MTAPEVSASLAELLAVAEEALEREDGPAAARAVEELGRRCAEAARAGVRIDRADLARLAEQHARVQARAVQLHHALAMRIEGAGRSRRAADAYRR